jgi:hypothetical protein
MEVYSSKFLIPHGGHGDGMQFSGTGWDKPTPNWDGLGYPGEGVGRVLC